MYSGINNITKLHCRWAWKPGNFLLLFWIILSIAQILFFGSVRSLHASSMYKSCTKQLYGELPKSGKLGFIGQQCMEKCDLACAKAFAIEKYNPNTEKASYNQYKQVYTDLNGVEKNDRSVALNLPGITECVATCREGKQYSGKLYKYDSYDGPGDAYFDIEVKDSCYDLQEDNLDFTRYEESWLTQFLDIGFNVDLNSVVLISVDNWRRPAENLLNEGKNELYTCGFKNISVFLDRDGIGQGRRPGFQYWTPKGHQWYDTGIAVAQDDYLAINYLGRYRSNGNCEAGDAGRCIDPNDYDLELTLDKPRSDATVLDNREFIRGSRIKESTLEYDNDYFKDKPELAEQIAESDAAYNLQYAEDEDKYKNKGLYFLNIAKSDKPEIFLRDPRFDALGYSYNKNKFRSTRAAGRVMSEQLNGFRGSKKLYMRHPFRNPATFSPVGGYDVNITWRGCYIEGRDNLYYALVPDYLVTGEYYYEKGVLLKKEPTDKMATKSKGGVDRSIYYYLRYKADWKRVAFDESGTATLSYMSESDFAYFDEALPGNTGKDPQKKPKFFRMFVSFRDQAISQGFKPWNSLGSYNLEFRKKEFKQKTGYFCDMLKKIFNIFTGDGETKGLAQIVYSNILKDNGYLNVVRLLLVIYIILMAIGFLIGVSRLSQTEALYSVLKIAFILLLISEKSWEIIYNNFLNVFIDGCRNLVNIFTLKIDNGLAKSEYCNNLGLDIFHSFDETLQITLGSKEVFWSRILALAFSGVFGFILSIFLLVAVLIYLLTIARAILLYLLCFIFSVILIMAAPIFIPTILFKMTKTMFDGWLKNLMVLTFQPVFVFAALSIFQELMLFMLKATLGFTICGVDWTIPIIGGGIPVYKALFNYHMPSDLSAPLNDIALIITFFLLVQAMSMLISSFTSMASRLISFLTMNLSDSGFSQVVASPISQALNSTARVFKMDSGSSSQRLRKRQKLE